MDSYTFPRPFSSRYSDGAKTRLNPPDTTVITTKPSTNPSDVCDSTLSKRNKQTSEYEEIISSMKLQHTSLLEELKRVREVYEQTKSDSLDQIRQIKTLEDYYTNQNELLTNEQIEYLMKILNLFQNFRGLNEHMNDLSLDDIKSQINQHIIYFSSIDKQVFSLNNNNHENEIITKFQLNNISLLLTKFEQKFSHLFNTNNYSNEFDETIENEHDDELERMINDNNLLRKFSSFLNDIYDKIKIILKDKNELDEKLILVEEKHLSYSRWEMQMYDILKWINEEKNARSHLKGLANRMAEELDRIRETTSPLLTVSSSTASSMNTTGTTLGHNTVR